MLCKMNPDVIDVRGSSVTRYSATSSQAQQPPSMLDAVVDGDWDMGEEDGQATSHSAIAIDDCTMQDTDITAPTTTVAVNAVVAAKEWLNMAF